MNSLKQYFKYILATVSLFIGEGKVQNLEQQLCINIFCEYDKNLFMYSSSTVL